MFRCSGIWFRDLEVWFSRLGILVLKFCSFFRSLELVVLVEISEFVFNNLEVLFGSLFSVTNREVLFGIVVVGRVRLV